MRIFDKHKGYATGKDPHKTPILMPVITVDIFAPAIVSINGKGFNQYVQSIEFFSDREYRDFLITNNIKQALE